MCDSVIVRMISFFAASASACALEIDSIILDNNMESFSTVSEAAVVVVAAATAAVVFCCFSLPFGGSSLSFLLSSSLRGFLASRITVKTVL